ncbi:MAG: succinyl-CoA--3-ketoacid-CoA transferase [Actinomycetota bacterium]|nr:MAG: succinyl-CoA--3-ketoacid-CoA transferase [Actinomycetota bacterium]
MAWTRNEIAARIAADIPKGWVVNIGVGMPTLVPGFIPDDREVLFQSENGILGMVALGPKESPDPELIDAGKRPIAVRPGGSFFESSLSFSMIRGGHIDLGIVGALQISRAGDIANWRTDEKMIGGIGGAADVCSGVKNLWVAMLHVTDTGELKLLDRCSYPLTAAAVVDRVYSDLAVLERSDDQWQVVSLAPGVSLAQASGATGFPIKGPD